MSLYIISLNYKIKNNNTDKKKLITITIYFYIWKRNKYLNDILMRKIDVALPYNIYLPDKSFLYNIVHAFCSTNI